MYTKCIVWSLEMKLRNSQNLNTFWKHSTSFIRSKNEQISSLNFATILLNYGDNLLEIITSKWWLFLFSLQIWKQVRRLESYCWGQPQTAEVNGSSSHKQIYIKQAYIKFKMRVTKLRSSSTPSSPQSSPLHFATDVVTTSG